MPLIKKYLVWIILLLAISLRLYVYFTKTPPCTEPIGYSVGSVDEKFGISRSDFVDIIINSEHVWEDSLNKNLFQYNAKSNFKINLIYDSRQQISNKNKILISKVAETRQATDLLKNEISSLQSRYNQVKNEYSIFLSQYKQRKSNYELLEEKRIEINTLADQINKKIKEYNLLVKSINSIIDVINQSSDKEFEEGQYVNDQKGERINIYEFSDGTVLTRLLAHELGHALGLNHNENYDSIMYYLNNSKNMKPTAEDIQALKMACKLK